MKKLTLTLAVLSTLTLGACTTDGDQTFVPVNNGRTAGSQEAVQRQYVDVDTREVRREVRRTRADRTFDKSMTK